LNEVTEFGYSSSYLFGLVPGDEHQHVIHASVAGGMRCGYVTRRIFFCLVPGDEHQHVIHASVAGGMRCGCVTGSLRFTQLWTMILTCSLR
jgi:hypothetical protein